MKQNELLQKCENMLINRCTPEVINELEQNEIFVFGSKPDGNHKNGAAKIALECLGAKYGCGNGFNGNSYAIEVHKHHLDKMAISILSFIDYAKKHKDLSFYVDPMDWKLKNIIPYNT